MQTAVIFRVQLAVIACVLVACLFAFVACVFILRVRVCVDQDSIGKCIASLAIGIAIAKASAVALARQRSDLNTHIMGVRSDMRS